MNQALRVLVVDDEPNLRTLFADFFKRKDAEVVTAEDGDEALSLIKSSKPFHAILTDIKMPGSMNGCQLIEAVHGSIKDHPLMFLMTGHEHQINFEKDLPVHMVFYKPFSITQVGNMVLADVAHQYQKPILS
jgi:CheY-like chemotaxis protein